MKKILYLTLTIITLPFYAAAFTASNLFKIKGYEDMETIKEYASMWNHIEDID